MYWQLTKKHATWWFELSTFEGTVNRESEFFKNSVIIIIIYYPFIINNIFKTFI